MIPQRAQRMTAAELADLTEYGGQLYRDMARAADLAPQVFPPVVAAMVVERLGPMVAMDWREFGQVHSVIVRELVPLVRDVLSVAPPERPTTPVRDLMGEYVDCVSTRRLDDGG